MSKIAALARSATALNLSLTGIRVEEIDDTKEAEKRIETLLQDDLDVLVLDERYRAEFSERLADRLRRHKGFQRPCECRNRRDAFPVRRNRG